jgi:hypothetical protein
MIPFLINTFDFCLFLFFMLLVWFLSNNFLFQLHLLLLLLLLHFHSFFSHLSLLHPLYLPHLPHLLPVSHLFPLNLLQFPVLHLLLHAFISFLTCFSTLQKWMSLWQQSHLLILPHLVSISTKQKQGIILMKLTNK